jgi:excisionase family DNA binding protein
MSSRLVGLAEAAKVLGVSIFTVRRLAEAGEIRVVNVGARRLISLTEIEKVIRHGAGKPRRRAGRA